VGPIVCREVDRLAKHLNQPCSSTSEPARGINFAVTDNSRTLLTSHNGHMAWERTSGFKTTHLIDRTQLQSITVYVFIVASIAQGEKENTPLSYTTSTLLTRNLDDVFGENDPVRRRAAIDEIFTEDCVFYEPKGCLPRPRRNQSDRRRDQGDSP